MLSPAPARIGLDGYNLAMPHGTGVATYGRVLGDTLAQAGHPLDGVFGLDVPGAASEGLREVLFFDRLNQAAPQPPPKPTLRRSLRRALISPLARRAVQAPVRGVVVAAGFEQRLPPFDRIFTLGNLFDVGARYFRRYGRFMTVRIPDPPPIMHWTYPLPLRLAGARNLYTIHDLVPLRLPHTTTEDKRYHYRLIQACLKRAAHVCTVSDASRRDILELFPATDPERVTNSYQATCPSAAVSDLSEQALSTRLGALFDLSPQGYLLFFGALEPKKNLGRLIEAYLGSGLDIPLVIVGGRSWMADHELRLLNGAHGAGLAGLSRIRRLEYLPQPLLMLLVRGARAVLFPSLYEGFGLPMVEAMGLGTPVLTSTTSCLPEIAGGAALLVDPYDVTAIEGALRRIAGDGALRAGLAEAGRRRAEAFSVAAYAGRLADLYARVLAAEPVARHPAGVGRAASQLSPTVSGAAR